MGSFRLNGSVNRNQQETCFPWNAVTVIYIQEHKNKSQHECPSQLSNRDEYIINTTNLLSKTITINDNMNTAICNAHIVNIRYFLNRRGSEKQTMNLKN